MSIYRVRKNSNYVVMSNTALKDKRLSWKAKGIMAYMLSMPDDWEFYITELVKHSTDGENSLRSGFKELKEYGYVKRYPVKDEKTNKILSWETHVFESPHNEKPLDENPHVENHQEGFHQEENSTLLSTDELSIDSPSIDKPSIDIPYVEIVNYLNEVSGKNYKATTSKTKEVIKARYNENFTLDDFKQVIDKKVNDWKNDPKMKKFIRPETLFGNKFEGYLNEEGGQHEGNKRKFEEQYGQYDFDKQREINF